MSGSASLKSRYRSGLALSVSIAALAISHNAQAQAAPCPSGQPGPVCVIANTGSAGGVVGTNGNVTVIENSGTISGTVGVQMGGSVALRVDNQVGGTITGTGGTAITGVPRLFYAVVNSGTINGDVVYNDAPATNIFTNPRALYVADGGTVNGNVTLGTTGYSSGIFLYRGASTGVSGTISGGGGLDIYGRVYEASQSVAIGQNVLPATFEIEAFFADGPATTLTLTGTGTTVNLGGDGHVVNTATINPISTAGLFPGGFTFNTAAVTYVPPIMAVFRRPQIQLGQSGSFFSIGYGSALGSFTNGGIINSDVHLATASFVNNGEINLQTAAFGSTIYSAADSAFSFDNSGSITLTQAGARYTDTLYEFEDGQNAAVRLRSAINTTAAADVTIANSGTIVGGLHGRFAAEDFVFTNTGSIEGIDNTGSYLAPGLVLWVGELNLVTGQDPESHYDAVTASFTNTATGSIDHGTELNLSAFVAAVTNNGFMAGADAHAALIVEQYLDAENVDAASFAFTNTGEFEGNVSLELATTDVTLNNSGDVAGRGYILSTQTFPEVLFGGGVAFEVTNETTGANAVSFTNTGNIVTTAHAQSGVLIELDAENDANPSSANATVLVVNSGTISATGGATIISPEFAPFLLPDQFEVNLMGALVVDASDVSGTAQITIENQVGGLIEAGGALFVARPDGYYLVPDVPLAVATVAVAAAGKTITITNAGTIRGGTGTVHPANAVLSATESPDRYLAGAIQTEGDQYGPDQVYIASLDTVTNAATGVIVGSIDLGGNNDSLANNGQITGDVYLRDGDDTLINYGTLAGDVFFGAGNDSFTQGVNAIFDGIADGQEGEDSFFLDLTGGGTIDQTIYDRLLNFELLSLIGQGQVDIDLGDDDDALDNDGTLEGDVSLGGGDNSFANTGTIEGDVTGGDDTDDVANEGDIEGSVDLGDGDNQLANNGTITGDVTSGTGADQFDNGGTITGNVDLGAGANQFVNAGEVEGDVSAGNDDDVVTNSGSITGNVFLDEPEADEEQQAFASNMFRRTAATESVATGGADQFDNTGTLTGDLFAGGGNDAITNSGTITDGLDLGDGDDTLVLLGAWAIEGSAAGGVGDDAINLAVAGDTPQALHFGDFSGFETLALSSGTGVLTDTMAFDQINITGGRLIGAAGSTITGDVAVSSGATFGSAGQVTGDIAVASGGILSPGASPAVMSVTGDVSLAAGSTTLFEFVPAPGQSDQLLIDGTLTIASGATLNLTGNRPLTPGLTHDLIVADTITGQFTIGTWDRSLVQGLLRYVDGASDDRLQLFSTFVFLDQAGPAPVAAINYVNELLVDGTASAALLTGLNTLLDGTTGFASVAAFTLLTPEPYASATQSGIETGLGLARTARSGLGRGTGDDAGLYGFGSGFGTWRTLANDPGLGTSRARNRANGVIGGLGFGSETASLGAFVGHIDRRQRISALGAQTNSDGMVAGVIGHVGAGAFNLDALAAYDWSEADTSRTVPANGTVSSRYNLRSFVLGGAATYDLAMGRLAVTPGMGLTHLSVRRGAASETGSAAYGLNVDADRHSATVIDASISFGETDAGAVRPRLSAGVRHQLEGSQVAVSAGLLGSAARFTVSGAPRKDTVITAGAGIEADVGTGVTVSAAYDGEFGGGAGSSATLGLRFRF